MSYVLFLYRCLFFQGKLDHLNVICVFWVFWVSEINYNINPFNLSYDFSSQPNFIITVTFKNVAYVIGVY